LEVSPAGWARVPERLMDVAEAVLIVLGEIAAGTSAARLDGRDVRV